MQWLIGAGSATASEAWESLLYRLAGSFSKRPFNVDGQNGDQKYSFSVRFPKMKSQLSFKENWWDVVVMV